MPADSPELMSPIKHKLYNSITAKTVHLLIGEKWSKNGQQGAGRGDLSAY